MGSALRALLMKYMFSPTQAHCTDKQVGFKNGVKSNSVFRHDDHRSATDLEGAYVLECAKVVLKLSWM